MDAASIPEFILAGVAALSLISAALVTVYKRGGGERELTLSMKESSRVNTELTTVVGGLKESLDKGFLEVHNRIDNHDVRLAVAQRDIEHLNAWRLAGAARDVAMLEHLHSDQT